MRVIPLLAVLLALLAAAPADAATKSLTASSGDVEATLSWRTGGIFVRDIRLQIVRAGLAVFDQQLLDDSGEPAIDLPQKLRVRDLDGDGEPEVVADLYTNGAHCCLYSLIYRYVASTPAAYHAVLHLWGNVGYRLKDLDGNGLPELESADDRFAYAFTSFAGSGFPIQIWRYSGSDFEAGDVPTHWGDPHGAYYEKAMTMRSIENAIYFASVNYALQYPESATSLIDPAGRCQAYLPYGEEGVLVQAIRPEESTGLLAQRYAPDRYKEDAS